MADDEAEDEVHEIEPDEAGAKKKRTRDAELSTRKAVREKLLDLFDDVSRGYDNQAERGNDILDNWDMMNCVLGGKQAYGGNSRIFVPLIRDAVEARVTRFTNQVFPKSGRYIDVTSANGDIPFAYVALLEHYVRAAKLRTEVIPAMFRSGDNEGNWTLYVDWITTERRVVKRTTKPLEIDGEEAPELGEVDTTTEEVIKDGRPRVTVVSDLDLLVLPVTANSIEEALEAGGSVTVKRRWTKGVIKKMAADNEIAQKAADTLCDNMQSGDKPGQRSSIKKQAEAAGIKTEGGTKHVVVYETWTKLKVDGEHRLCRAYYAGAEIVLGCKVNPYWNDRCPVITKPIRKVPDMIKARPPVSDVVDMQIAANDQTNMGFDTAMFSAMPIIMTDPLKNPKTDSMVLGLAALWETSPTDTKFAQFPALWKDSLEIVAGLKQQISQSLGVNPSMMPQSTGGRGKRNQAEIALEQQVDILTTADVVTGVEEGILNEVLMRFAEYDHQFRDDKLTVQAFGPMGRKANMEDVEPMVLGRGMAFTWLGVEAARNAAERQNQIAFLNVLKGIPPQMTPGRKLDLGPALDQAILGVFGPRIGPLTFVDLAKEQSVDPMEENEMLLEGFDLMVHPTDEDPKHMQAHMQAMQQNGDPHGVFRMHIVKHQMQMQAKATAQAQQAGPGAPGSPGGAGPGVAGTPKPGSQPQPPRQMRGPGGMINPDQMSAAGAPGAPRKT